MRRYLVLVASLALLAGGAEGALAQGTSDTNRIQRLVQPSIVFLKTTYSAQVRDTNPEFRELLFDGNEVEKPYRCTGFFVNPTGYVATAGHCVLVDDEVRQDIIDEAGVRAYEEGQYSDETTLEEAIEYAREWFKLASRVSVSYLVSYPTTSTSVSTENTTEARLVGYRAFEKGDIGLLKFETAGVDMPGLELAESGDVQVGTPVVAVGFPGSVDQVTDADYNPSFKGGEISSVKTTGGGQVAVYEHNADSSGGMSGGPVVDSDGRVVGVTSFGVSGETQAFNFATPVALLNEVLGDKNVENDVGDVGRTYRAGVDALDDRDKGKAIARFEEVLDNTGNPALSQAAILLREARELPDEGFPWWGYALIVAGIVALAAGAAVVLRRRRTAAPALGTPALAGVPAGAGSPVRAETPPPPPSAPATADSNAPSVVVIGPQGETAVRHGLTGEMVIGREAADILLDDEQISRRHALLRVDEGHVELSDLRSANGTEVNGQRITSTVTLANGDTIKVGSTELRVELPPSMRGARRSDATVVAPRPKS